MNDFHSEPHRETRSENPRIKKPREAAAWERRLLNLSSAEFSAFAAELDRMPAENAGLKRLLETLPPWEK